MAGDVFDKTYDWLGGDKRLTTAELRVVGGAVAGDGITRPEGPVRAEVLRRLYTQLDDGWRLSVLGLRVDGAEIIGVLDLAGLAVSGAGFCPPLALTACRFDSPPNLDGARLDAVCLDGSRLPGLSARGLVLARGFAADHAVCSGEILLEDCRAGDAVSLRGVAPPKGETLSVSLTGAALEGDLTLAGAELRVEAGRALNLDGACIRNVDLTSARIIGRTDARAVRIPVQWNAVDARFDGLGGDAIGFDSAVIGGVFLDGSTMIGAVRAIGVAVAGQWNANRATFQSPGGTALSLDAAELGGVFLIGAVAQGEVRAPGAVVHGVFNAQGAGFSNPAGEALNLAGAEVGGGLYFQDVWNDGGALHVERPVRIAGQLDLARARILGDLALDGAVLTAAIDGVPAGVAVDARALEVKGSLLWSVSAPGRRPSVRGAVNLGGARVDGDVDLTGLAAFHATPDMTAAPDPRGTFTRLGLADTAISMVGVEVGGDLRIGRAIFAALDPAPDLTPTGPSQPPSGDRDARGRPWLEPVSGAPTFVATAIDGCLDLSRAVIRRDLVIDGAGLAASRPVAEVAAGAAPAVRAASTALSLHGAAIAKALRVRRLAPGVDPSRAGRIDLRSAVCDELDDGRGGEGWGPTPSGDGAGYRLDLDGFVYGRLEDADAAERSPRPWDAVLSSLRPSTAGGDRPLWARRTAWLLRQYRGSRPTPADYSPQPWGQLAATLKATGRDEDARRVTIAHYDFRLRSGVEGLAASLWSRAVSLLFRYGYSPGRVAVWFAAFLMVGDVTVRYWIAQDARARATASATPCASLAFGSSSAKCPYLVTPSKADAPDRGAVSAPCEKGIAPGLYAIDVFLPVVNLKEQDRCDINPGRPEWRWIKAFYALWGWIFTPLAALTFAGVLKRD
ncbi:MAG: hypothetical protein ABI376_00425 [Caulobacteraceae bacterium]